MPIFKVTDSPDGMGGNFYPFKIEVLARDNRTLCWYYAKNKDEAIQWIKDMKGITKYTKVEDCTFDMIIPKKQKKTT